MDFLSFVPIAGVISGIISIILIINLFRRIRNKKRGFYAYMVNILGILLFGLLSSTFLLMYSSFKSYDNFTYKEKLYSIVCSGIEDDWFVLELIPAGKKVEESKIFRINGQQFIIDGHIVKWNDFFSSVGMKPLYQITRVSGRWVKVEDEMNRERSVYELSEESAFWLFMMRHGEIIPGVEAVYGSATFTYPDEKDTLSLLITHSGFILKKK